MDIWQTFKDLFQPLTALLLAVAGGIGWVVRGALKQHTSIKAEIENLEHQLTKATYDVQASIAAQSVEFNKALAVHDNRLQVLEATHERWDHGHALQGSITKLETRQVDTDNWIKSLRDNVHELRNLMQVTQTDVAVIKMKVLQEE